MKKIRLVSVAFAISITLLFGLLSCAKRLTQNKKLNVIIVLLDALRADQLSVYGNSRRTSPYIDSLKPNSLLCEHAFSQAPWTPASVASLFTGTHTTVHWVIQGNGGIDPGSEEAKEFPVDTFGILDPKMITMPEVFKAAGYQTAVFSGNYWISPRLGYAQGVDRFVNVEFKHYQTDELFQRTIYWLSDNQDKPFFLYLHVFDPHNPYEPPPPFDRLFWQEPRPEKFQRISGLSFRAKWEFLAKVLPAPGPDHATEKDVEYLRAMYDSEISYVDWWIGVLLRQMDKWGILENTLVVITGDHGDSFNEHGYFDHGWHMYNTDFHIPLILYNRKLFPKTVDVSTPVQLIDLFPTLVDLIHYQRPPQLQGNSLLKPVSQTAYSEGKYLKGYKIQSNDWSLITDPSLNPTELYHVKDDPGETVNTIAANPEVTSELLKALKKQHDANLTNPYRSRRLRGKLDQETIERLKSLGYVD